MMQESFPTIRKAYLFMSQQERQLGTNIMVESPHIWMMNNNGFGNNNN